jgi:hypothetical protein
MWGRFSLFAQFDKVSLIESANQGKLHGTGVVVAVNGSDDSCHRCIEIVVGNSQDQIANLIWRRKAHSAPKSRPTGASL